MKQFALLLILSCALFSCKKEDKASPSNPNNPNNPTNPTNPYYFKFTLNGTNYNLNSSFPQYMSSDDYNVGGYQDTGPLTYPSVGLRFRFDSTVTDAQVKALAGQTIYLDNSNPRPQITFDQTLSGNTLYSIDTPNTAFNVKISSVSYLKVDTTIFNIVDVYVIKGTCSAVMEDYATGATSTLSNGDFNFLISRVKR